MSDDERKAAFEREYIGLPSQGAPREEPLAQSVIHVCTDCFSNRVNVRRGAYFDVCSHCMGRNIAPLAWHLKQQKEAAQEARARENELRNDLRDLQQTVAVLRDALLSRLPETALEPLHPSQVSMLHSLVSDAVKRAMDADKAMMPPRRAAAMPYGEIVIGYPNLPEGVQVIGGRSSDGREDGAT